MDLATVRGKLGKFQYAGWLDLKADLARMVQNALMYNQAGQPVHTYVSRGEGWRVILGGGGVFGNMLVYVCGGEGGRRPQGLCAGARAAGLGGLCRGPCRRCVEGVSRLHAAAFMTCRCTQWGPYSDVVLCKQ
jgi:hypothetical protein